MDIRIIKSSLRLGLAAALALPAFALVASAAPFGGPTPPSLLLADDSRVPHVRVSWTRSDGSNARFEADLPYASPDQARPLGENVLGFVGLGGARLEKGAGHAAGAIVRVGLFKANRERLFFDDIAYGSSVVIELTNVAFNQAVLPDPSTLVHRLEYKAEDVEACGLTVDEAEMYNIASPDDDMGGALLPKQVRFASLDGSDPGDATIQLAVAHGGAISMRAVLPYRLLRHKGDPWGLEVPGTFFEPFHFDLEFEVLPERIAQAEGVRLTADDDSR